jgi:hypothetical protein
MDGVPPCYAADPNLDVKSNARELLTLCDRATHKE